MTFENPHIKVPLHFTSDGADYIEQDTREEIIQNVWTVLAYRKGQLVHFPGFGVADQTFRMGGADLNALRAAVEEFEPRARVLFEREPGLLTTLIDQINVRTED